MRFKEIDGCPAPEKLYPALVKIKNRTPGLVYNSIYRGSDPKAAGILRRFGKATQVMLSNGWVRHLPGFNPANLPGFSTHELFNDGVAYPVPRGTPLRYYQVGIDSTNAPGFVESARELGFTATITYPGNPREGHHANFRRQPKLKVFNTLRKGSSGARVPVIRKNLALVCVPETGHPYLASPKRSKGSQFFFDANLSAALKAFQRDHMQKADGVYGIRTARQLNASVRYHKNKAKKR